ncbi:phosphatidylethanolamine N-methyltransferase [Rhizophlyctis rosea]|nr:phosphatidylethanolamine N-methyltransferase [Rhizophlyctis rosea]
MLHTLFSPSAPHTLPEWITLALIGIQASLFLFTNTPREVFLVLFLCWRAAYNGGLGVLLRWQSKDRGIVNWARRNGFDSGVPREKREPWVQYMIDGLIRKMGGYDYESYPLEFNAWLLYRGLVDIILVNDFTTYMLFVFSYFRSPEGGTGWIDIMRYVGGALLLAFNLWVKTDAHRVVKDFAWYWGDFFFLSSTTLTFDGVFELAPHPMYSVGYIGYYGAALIAQSYWVLFVSLAAHAAQMGFLWKVEEPHIEKTYGGGEPHTSQSQSYPYFRRDLIIFKNFDFFRSTDLLTAAIVGQTVFTAFMVGPIDTTKRFGDWRFWFYLTQALFWRVIYSYGLGAVLYLQAHYRWWNKHFIKHGDSAKDAFGSWKVLYNTTQVMTYTSFLICAARFFVAPEADKTLFEGTFLLRCTLGVLFILLHLHVSHQTYNILGPNGWFYSDFFHPSLVLPSGPIYTGIYRFIDNPLLPLFSYWGLSLISSSPALYALTVFSQISEYIFVKFVEEPYVRRLYGGLVREEGGVEKVVGGVGKRLREKVERGVREVVREWELEEFVGRVGEIRRRISRGGEGEGRKVGGRHKRRKSAKSSEAGEEGLRRRRRNQKEGEDVGRAGESSTGLWTSDEDLSSEVEIMTERLVRKNENLDVKLRNKVEQVIEELEDLIDGAKPRLRHLLSESTLRVAKLGAVKGVVERPGVPSELYSLTVDSGRFELGEDISVTFVAPLAHVRSRDWIGIYPVGDNPSKDVTTVKSSGRWVFIDGSYKSESEGGGKSKAGAAAVVEGRIGTTEVVVENVGGVDMVRGSVTLRGSQLPWKCGRYEIRYHFDSGYAVITSLPTIEIYVTPFMWPSSSSIPNPSDEKTRIVTTLRGLVSRCLGGDVSPQDDIWEGIRGGAGADVGKGREVVAKRIVYGVKQVFGIDFSFRVLEVVRSVEGFGERIFEAREVLAPSSPSSVGSLPSPTTDSPVVPSPVEVVGGVDASS